MTMVAKKPAWLQGLMAETFFSSCEIHCKSKKNVFCLLCCLSLCPHCLPSSRSHRSHPLLQVRRYVYHDVVQLSDLEKLIDCSDVQPYKVNGAKVIFINKRPKSKVSSNVCFTCDRILQEPFHFCSLSCKVEYLGYQGDDLSSILYRIDQSDFTFEGLRMDGHDQLGDISTMEDADDVVVVSSEQGDNSSKREIVLSSHGRRRGRSRKGVPHRAPFSKY